MSHSCAPGAGTEWHGSFDWKFSSLIACQWSCSQSHTTFSMREEGKKSMYSSHWPLQDGPVSYRKTKRQSWHKAIGSANDRRLLANGMTRTRPACSLKAAKLAVLTRPVNFSKSKRPQQNWLNHGSEPGSSRMLLSCLLRRLSSTRKWKIDMLAECGNSKAFLYHTGCWITLRPPTEHAWSFFLAYLLTLCDLLYVATCLDNLSSQTKDLMQHHSTWCHLVKDKTLLRCWFPWYEYYGMRHGNAE